MPSSITFKTSFISGVLSELLDARIDTEAYQNGLAQCENFIITPQGPAQNRAGTEYIATLRDDSKNARLIEFVFSNEQAYVLCFNDGYIRFFADQQAVGAPYEIAHPYSDSEIDEIQVAQSADIMWIVHPNHKPRELKRLAHTNWTLTNYAPTADPFTAANNYPSTVTIFEQRLVFGNTNNDPQKIFSTKGGDYQDMTTGTAATDAFVYVLGTNDINAINWLFGDDDLLIGTNGGVFVARASGYGEAITPTNISIKRHTSYRASKERAKLIQDIPMFIGRLKRKLIGLGIPSDSTKYRGKEATIRNPDITEPGVEQLSYQQEPSSILWMVRGDGCLVGVTIEVNEGVTAWHEHCTTGTFESIAVTPSSAGDELWAVVKRNINGADTRYVELFKDREESTIEDAWFIDCALQYSGASTSTLTGLSHLEGESVTILADGMVHPNETVSSGQVSLDYSVTKAIVGLGYESTLKSLPLESDNTGVASQSTHKRLVQAWVRLRRTIGLQVGEVDDLDVVSFRDFGDDMDTQVPLFTGDKEVEFDGEWGTEARLMARQVLPLPATVLGWKLKYVGNSG